MKHGENDGEPDEVSLVKLYADVTGATESQARSVFMHVCSKRELENATPPAENVGPLVEDDWQPAENHRAAGPWLERSIAVPVGL